MILTIRRFFAANFAAVPGQKGPTGKTPPATPSRRRKALQVRQSSSSSSVDRPAGAVPARPPHPARNTLVGRISSSRVAQSSRADTSRIGRCRRQKPVRASRSAGRRGRASTPPSRSALVGARAAACQMKRNWAPPRCRTFPAYGPVACILRARFAVAKTKSHEEVRTGRRPGMTDQGSLSPRWADDIIARRGGERHQYIDAVRGSTNR